MSATMSRVGLGALLPLLALHVCLLHGAPPSLRGRGLPRIAAARASREHPALLTMLAEGRLHLTAIAKVAPHWTAENRERLLERAAHETKRQVEELLVELAPRPDAPALIRKVPERRTIGTPAPRQSLDPIATSAFELRSDGVVSPTTELRLDGGEATRLSLIPELVPSPGAELRPDGVDTPKLEPQPERVAASASPATVQPPSPGRYKVQFTASAELRDKLEFHHRHPFALGGDHSPERLALLCRTHNHYLAEVDYGRLAIARHRRPSTGPPSPARLA